jgi:hypothetical protein
MRHKQKLGWQVTMGWDLASWVPVGGALASLIFRDTCKLTSPQYLQLWPETRCASNTYCAYFQYM